VGSNIGLSPLLALISMYAGLKTLGFLGIIFFPIILLTVISLNEKGIIRLYKNPTDSQTDVITKNKHKFLNFKKDEKSNRHR
jgi:predicted PurR-regulated permease PerM